MSEEFTLSKIKIGYADGEKEAEEDNFLSIFYTENNKYNELMERYKFIISGRKGTGKTVLAKYYQTINNHKNTIIDYTKLGELSLRYYIENYSLEIDEKISRLFQEYFIYTQFIITILKNKKKYNDFINKNDTFFTKINKYFFYRQYVGIYDEIKQLYDSLFPDGPYKEKEIKEMIKEAQNFYTAVEMQQLPVSSNNNISHENSKETTKVRKNFAENIPQFKKLVCECLKYVNVSIIIDDLDEIKMKNTSSLITFLIDLVTVVNDINMTVSKSSRNSKCILLLRSDLISSFNKNSSNINKILIDCNVELDWFRNSSELKKMIMYKIKNADESNTLKNLSLDDIETVIFATSQDKKNNTFKKISSYSFGRPRDIISYIDCIIKNNPNAKQITFPMLSESEEDYSQKLFSEIQNEMSLHFADNQIHDIEYLLRSFRKKYFNYQDIVTFYQDHVEQFPSIINIDITLQYLYQLGLIGNSKKMKKNRYYYSWSYRNGGELLDKELSLVVHFGICKALNII